MPRQLTLFAEPAPAGEPSLRVRDRYRRETNWQEIADILGISLVQVDKYRAEYRRLINQSAAERIE